MKTNYKKNALPNWKRNAISGAIAFALSNTLYITPASAVQVSCPNSITSSIGSCDATGVSSIDISSSGSVRTSQGSAISYNDSLNGILTNNGTISSSGDASSATGVWIDNDLGGTLTNNGLIEANAGSTNADSGTAYGVYAGNTLSGKLNNNGTINAVAHNGTNNSANAYGVGVTDLSGTLSNTGIISAAATSNDNNSGDGAYNNDARAYADGVRVSFWYGTLSNTGIISAAATSNGNNSGDGAYNNYAHAYADGVYVEQLSGILNNDGTINAAATSTISGSGGENYHNGAYAYANGVDISGLSGTLTNNGTISASATSSIPDRGGLDQNYYDHARAYANGVRAHYLSGTLTNSGTINATAASTGDNNFNYYGEDNSGANANGVVLNRLAGGTLTNTGTGAINAAATGNAAGATGVIMGSSSSSVRAAAALVANASGTLTNNGSISATASGHTYAGAMGVYASYFSNGLNPKFGVNSATAMPPDTGVPGSLTNTGSISAVAASNYQAGAAGVGLGLESLINQPVSPQPALLSSTYGASYGSGYLPELNNSGTISASASVNNDPAIANDGQVFAAAAGVAISPIYNGNDSTLTNSGSINATAQVNEGLALAAGVFILPINPGSAGTLTNSGTISASASSTGTGSQVAAVGVDVGYFPVDYLPVSPSGRAVAQVSEPIIMSDYALDLNNSGTIRATATGNDAMAYGVYVNNLGSTLNNSGTITGSANNANNGYSVYVDAGTIPQTPTVIDAAPEKTLATAEVSPFQADASSIGSINNLAGGLLSGNIYTAGDVAVNNAGTIAIPAGVQGHINGNYSQSSTGVLSIVATSASNYGQLDVGGIATMAPGTTINVSAIDGTHTLARNQVLTNVLSAGTLNADTVKVTDNSVLFDFTPNVYTGNAGHIDLKIERGITILESVLHEGNVPAIPAAAVLDSLVYTGGGTKEMGDVINAFGNMTSEKQVSDAVTQTLPALTSGVANMTILTTNAGDSVIGSRQELVRGLSAGDELRPDSHVWLKPFGNWTQQDKRNGIDGYNADNFGIAIGGDMDVTSTWNAGLAFIYNHGNVHSNSTIAPQRIDMNTYTAKIYATKKFGESTRLNFQAGGGASTYDSSRNINFMGTIADANYDGRQGRAKVELEHDFVVAKKTKVTPYVGLNYVHVHVGSYNEKGANALNLKVNGDSQDSLVIGGGVKVAQEVTDKLLLTAKVGGGYDPVISASTLTSSFTGGGAVFSTQGINPAKGVFGGNVSAKYTMSANSEITVGYDVQARENFIDQAATLNVRIKF